jgi:hypothetical protein
MAIELSHPFDYVVAYRSTHGDPAAIAERARRSGEALGTDLRAGLQSLFVKASDAVASRADDAPLRSPAGSDPATRTPTPRSRSSPTPPGGAEHYVRDVQLRWVDDADDDRRFARRVNRTTVQIALALIGTIHSSRDPTTGRGIKPVVYG